MIRRRKKDLHRPYSQSAVLAPRRGSAYGEIDPPHLPRRQCLPIPFYDYSDCSLDITVKSVQPLTLKARQDEAQIRAHRRPTS